MMDMIDRIIRFCEQDVWTMNVHKLTGLRQFGVKVSRLGLVAASEFRESFLSIRATSLVYTTLLSLVPFLAVTFSVLKAFGIHQQIEPILSQALDPLGEKGAVRPMARAWWCASQARRNRLMALASSASPAGARLVAAQGTSRCRATSEMLGLATTATR